MLTQLTHLQNPDHLSPLLWQKRKQVEAFFEGQWQTFEAPIYASCDLRFNGYKMASIDTNLFPAGFNNLDSTAIQNAVKALKAFLKEKKVLGARALLLIENHTRNHFYFENVIALLDLLQQAGLEVEVCNLANQPTKLIEGQNGSFELHPIRREGACLFASTGAVDFVIVNNDLSTGIPEILQNLEQPIFPLLSLGWHQRLKSQYFFYYQQIVQEFAQSIDLDPWFFEAYYQKCGQVDFKNKEGEECVVENVALLLEKVKEKYQQYQINQQPFVVVKSDNGTYGMNVLAVQHAHEIQQLNRKKRQKMAFGKEGSQMQQVILQEGIATCETLEGLSAEPVVYFMGKKAIGGFYRYHQKFDHESLNSPGMKFKKINHNFSSVASEGITNTYQVVAQLALLAASLEAKKQDKKIRLKIST